MLTNECNVTIIIVIIASKQPFNLIYAPKVKQHPRAIEVKYHPLIRTLIESQLLLEPNIETRNRKPLKRSSKFEGAWEIRFGPGKMKKS